MAYQIYSTNQPLGTIVSKTTILNNFQLPYDQPAFPQGNGYFAGLVTDNGVPFVADVQVWSREFNNLVGTVTTESDGRYEIGGYDEASMFDLIAVDPSGDRERRISSSRFPASGWNRPIGIGYYDTSPRLRGEPYSALIKGYYGTGSYTFSMYGAPGWLSLDTGSGVLSGTNAGESSVSFTVTATDDTTAKFISLPLTVLFNTSLANVISLLHFEGTNGSTTFTDTVPGVTWTAFGTTVISTAQYKFGAASGDSGASFGRITAAPTNSIGTGDFTVEFFVRLKSTTTQVFFDGRTSSVLSEPGIYWNSNLIYYTQGADRIIAGTMTTGVWYHVAVSRSSGSTKMFLDGTQVGSTYTDTGNYTFPLVTLFARYDNGFHTDGYIDEFRFSSVALYTSNFTPPSAPFGL